MSSTNAGKKNIYLCTQCGRGHVTIDRDVGVTPFSSGCLHCEGMAISMFYAAPQQALERIPAALEWYRPSEPELAMMTRSTIEHVQNGGLLSRALPVKGGA